MLLVHNKENLAGKCKVSTLTKLYPGDKVKYIGWDNRSLYGRLGYVTDRSADGTAYVPNDRMHKGSTVPVQFDTMDRPYGAWFKNLKLVENEKPNWEI